MPDVDDAQLRQLVAEGLSQREIARRTGLARATLYRRFRRLGIAPGQTPAAQTEQGPLSTVDVPPIYPLPSTVDPLPSTADQLRIDLQAALTAALQPVLTRLEALETGLARPPAEGRPPSTIHDETVHPDTGRGGPVGRPPPTVDPQTWEMRPLKHSVRWTVYVPQALKDEIQRQARARQQHPSVFLQELLWQALKTVSSSTPGSS
jgi:transcriptional regulator with XRE-family HTH domain